MGVATWLCANSPAGGRERDGHEAGAPETLMEVETQQAGAASPAGRQRNK